MRTRIRLSCFGLLSLACFCSPAVSAGEPEELVSMRTGYALRAQNHIVEISVQSDRTLTLRAGQRQQMLMTRKIELDAIESRRLASYLDKLDWKTLSEEDTQGLDGKTVTIRHGANTISVWSPDYDTRKRQLQHLVALSDYLNQLAGLTKEGLPK